MATANSYRGNAKDALEKVRDINKGVVPVYGNDNRQIIIPEIQENAAINARNTSRLQESMERRNEFDKSAIA
mgnify:CR=1 FL=1